MPLEVVKYRDVLPILRVKGVVVGSDPPAVEVIGDDFTSAAVVYINDIKVSKFSIPNKTTLIAEIPSGQENNLRDMEILSSRLTKENPRSRVAFRIGDRPEEVGGVFALLQLFMKWLLQDPGSDIFNIMRGGGLQGVIGGAMGTRNMDVVTSAITQAVSRTVEQVMVAQASATGLRSDERLLDATLVDLHQDEELLELSARIQVTSMAGNSAMTSLLL